MEVMGGGDSDVVSCCCRCCRCCCVRFVVVVLFCFVFALSPAAARQHFFLNIEQIKLANRRDDWVKEEIGLRSTGAV